MSVLWINTSIDYLFPPALFPLPNQQFLNELKKECDLKKALYKIIILIFVLLKNLSCKDETKEFEYRKTPHEL